MRNPKVCADGDPSTPLRSAQDAETLWRQLIESAVVKSAAASCPPFLELVLPACALQPHLFHRVRRYPAPLIIRQRRVIPVTALLQNHNFASRWQSQNTSCTVDGRNSGFGVFRNHNCQALAARSVFQCEGSEPANRGQKYTGYCPQHSARSQDQKIIVSQKKIAATIAKKLAVPKFRYFSKADGANSSECAWSCAIRRLASASG